MIDLSEIFNCGDLSKFETIIKTRLSVPPHVGSSIFYLCEYDKLRMLVKIYLYRKNMPELYNFKELGTTTEADSEIKIMSILREEFINTKITPCIANLFFHKTCNNLVKNIKATKNNRITEGLAEDLENYQNLIDAGLAENKISYLVMELCNDGLNDLVETSLTPTSITTMRNVLFQLVYTLAVITDKYPQFKHGDLHYGNVLLQVTEEFDETAIKYMAFTFKGKTWHVPYMGFTIKIIDFGYSSLPEKNIVSSINDDKVYKYYLPHGGDLSMFLYTVYQQNRAYMQLFKELDYSDEFIYGSKLLEEKSTAVVFPKYSELLDRVIFKNYLATSEQKNIIAEYKY